jgi:hypothetical protein
MAREYTRSLVVGQVVTLTAVQPDKYDKRVDAYCDCRTVAIWTMR